MDNTIIMQGTFTSDGRNKFIPLRGGVQWMEVYNLDVVDAIQTVRVPYMFYWQRGFPNANRAILYMKADNANTQNMVVFDAVDDFFVVDTTASTPGAAVALTAISNANPPVVTSVGSALAEGTVVRLINVTGASQFGGYDFTVGYNTLTANTFSLDYAAQIAAATNGFFRVIPFDPYFYPRNRSITKITQAANAVITLSVTHGFTVGQSVRIYVPAAFGMTQMNGLQATIVAIDTDVATGNTITVDVDSTAFTAFAFPVDGAAPFTPAQVVPIGEDTGAALVAGQNILADATENQGQLGMLLIGGDERPGGDVGELMMWRAGVSFSDTIG